MDSSKWNSDDLNERQDTVNAYPHQAYNDGHM